MSRLHQQIDKQTRGIQRNSQIILTVFKKYLAEMRSLKKKNKTNQAICFFFCKSARRSFVSILAMVLYVYNIR